jgi:hypothetical protein
MIWICSELNKEQLSLLKLFKIRIEFELKIKEARGLKFNRIGGNFQKLKKFGQEAPVYTWMTTQLIKSSLRFQTRNF